ncbi:MAG TPA: peptidylprolyl isomerase [Trueperaceae bacterium]
MKPHNLARLVFSLLLLAAAALASAQNAPQDPVVARLGDRTVTASEFDMRFELVLRTLLARQGVPYSPEMKAQFAALQPQVLEQEAARLALLDAADKRGLKVTDEEVASAVDQAKSGFDTPEAFDKALAAAGYGDEDTFRKSVREDLAVQKVIQALAADIDVTDADVQAEYEAHPEQFQVPEQVCARHILVDTEAEAKDIKQALADGGDFQALAKEKSTDPGSASRGGDLGCFSKGQMVPPFEEAAFGAKEGVVVGPVQSQFGYHLILVYDHKEAGTVPLEQVKGQIKSQLQNQQLQAKVQELRDGSGVEVFPENLPQPAAPDTGAPSGGAQTGGAQTGGAQVGGAAEE